MFLVLAPPPVGSEFSSGPPPGFTSVHDDPNRAFNPVSGQNLIRQTGNWFDAKTYQVIVAPKLCP